MTHCLLNAMSHWLDDAICVPSSIESQWRIKKVSHLTMRLRIGDVLEFINNNEYIHIWQISKRANQRTLFAVKTYAIQISMNHRPCCSPWRSQKTQKPLKTSEEECICQGNCPGVMSEKSPVPESEDDFSLEDVPELVLKKILEKIPRRNGLQK